MLFRVLVRLKCLNSTWLVWHGGTATVVLQRAGAAKKRRLGPVVTMPPQPPAERCRGKAPPPSAGLLPRRPKIPGVVAAVPRSSHSAKGSDRHWRGERGW